MFRKVIGTLGARIFCTLISFGIVIINSHEFGPSGLGTIGLFLLGVTILQNLTSFVGGPSLVYMLPRNNVFQLIFLSYVFNLLINILGTYFLFVLNLIPKEFVWHLFFASIFFSLYYINSLVILSHEKIKIYNILSLIQIIIQLLLMVILLFLLHVKEISAFIYAYLFSYVLVALISIPYIWKDLKFNGFNNIFLLLKQMLSYGFIIQIANFAQLLNYRLSYYIIEFCSGRKALGLFDLGTKLSEAVWILPKSMATVQYARISNCKDNIAYAKKLSLAFLKLSFVFAFCATLFLVCLPAQWIAWIFGPEFMESKKLLYVLALGIVLFSCNIIVSHYFSSFGLYKINAIASLIGVIITAGLGVSLIPWFSNKSYMDVILGVGGITSLSYISSFIYTFIRFIKHSHLKFKELWFDKKDIHLLQTEIKKILRNHDKNKAI